VALYRQVFDAALIELRNKVVTIFLHFELGSNFYISLTFDTDICVCVCWGGGGVRSRFNLGEM
jgi:hypothetical protein